VEVSAFGYGYDAGGSITRWTQGQPFHTVEPMSAWTIEQDAADQLTGVSVEGRAAGRLRFSGTTSEAAHVSVQGRAKQHFFCKFV
jgi:hypothetical protein